MNVAPTLCLHCSKPIKSGRSDKKFCDSGCKDEFYNAIKTAEHSQLKQIGSILKKNMKILRGLYDPQKPDKRVSKEILIRAGFEFGFHTHIALGTLNNQNEFIFCYNFGYREVYKDYYQVYPLNKKVTIKGGGIFLFK